MSKPDDPPAPAKAPDTRQKIAREQRLAKALRDNLRRRKGLGASDARATDDGES